MPTRAMRKAFEDQFDRGAVGIIQPSDGHWLQGKVPHLCICPHRSMERVTPMLFLLSMGRARQLYVATGGVRMGS